MKRWLLRLLILALLTAAGIVATVQIILTTDLPRRLALSIAQRMTGLQIEADSLTISWGGRTTLRNVTVHVPMFGSTADPIGGREAGDILEIPRLELQHTSLPALLFLRPFVISSVEVDRPVIRLHENERGRWNVQEAVVLLVDALGRRPPDPTRQVALPDVTVTDGRVIVRNRFGRSVEESPISLTGLHRPDLTYALDAAVGRIAHITGTLRPPPGGHGEWLHELNITLDRPLDSINTLFELELADAVEEPPWGPAGRLNWYGRFREGTLTGTLDIREGRYESLNIEGHLAVRVSRSRITAVPENLTLRHDDFPDEYLTLRAGVIEAKRSDDSPLPGEYTIERLLLEFPHGRVECFATWNVADRVGEMTLDWTGVLADETINHDGRLTASARMTAAGYAEVSARIASNGRSPAGSWQASLTFAGDGLLDDPAGMRGTLAAEQAGWVDSEGLAIDFAPVTLQWRGIWPEVTATGLLLPRGQVRRAEIRSNLRERTWRANVEVTDVDLRPYLDEPADIALVGSGDLQSAHLSHLAVKAAGATVQGSGTYHAAVSEHEHHHVDANLLIDLPEPSHSLRELFAYEAAEDLGRWRMDVDISGNLMPLTLDLSGRIDARDVPLADTRIGHMEIDFTGAADRSGIRGESLPFELLGGLWTLRSEYFHLGEKLHLAGTVTNFDLRRVSEVVDIPLELRGVGETDLRIALPLPYIDLNQVEAEGQWIARDVEVREKPPIEASPGEPATTPMFSPLGTDPLRASQASGRIRLRDGIIDLSRLRMQHPDGIGLLTGGVRLWIDGPPDGGGDVDLGISINQWPLRVPHQPVADQENSILSLANLDLVTDARIDARIRFGDLIVNGDVSGFAQLRHDGEPIAMTTFDGQMRRRRLTLSQFHLIGQVGVVHGFGVINLENWTLAEADCFIDRIDVRELAAFGLETEKLSGYVSGRLRLRPADDPRAFEPLLVELYLLGHDARYDTVTIDAMNLKCFIGPTRAIFEVEQFDLAGGTLKARARISQRNGQYAFHTLVQFDRLRLDQIYALARPDDDPVIGRVSGSSIIGGHVQHPHRPFGEVRMDIVESDLINVPGLSELYGALNVPLQGYSPLGEGSAHFRLEGNTLELIRMDYFNRGADVTASFSVIDIAMGRQSPVRGLAAGTVRPLRDIRLPLIGQVDRAIRAAQANVASIRINGTIEDINIAVVPFAEITGALQRILSGEVRSEE